MKKKVSICIIVCIIFSLVVFSFACYYLNKYIGYYNSNIDAINAAPRTPEEVQRLIDRFWKFYGSYIINISLIIFFSLSIVALLTVVLIWVNKADIDFGTATIKAKIQASREKRHQKKIEKAKALLESEDKRDE